jgi:hypothetical protein
MSDRLVRTIYASRTAPGFGPAMIEGILSSARRHNGTADVTGLLAFSSDYFLQCLEGGRAAVNEIYARICRDDRHQAPQILLYEECSERSFAQWSMGYVGGTALTAETLRRFGGSSRFEPTHLGGSAALALLEALAGSVKTS